MHEIDLIKATDLFDPDWYRAEYPDVAATGIDAAEHYYRFGARLYRDPSERFSTRYYLGAYPDVAAAGLNPLIHYLRHGRQEGRRPRPKGRDAVRYGQSVDVVIPVFDALPEVRACIAAVVAHADDLDLRLIVVNDGSQEETSQWLRLRCGNDPMFVLIEHARNFGYTRAVNSGIKASSARYVVTLNSDTEVTPGWLRGMLRCFASDRGIGIVGPLSNAASWQNVPDLFDPDGTFSVNPLPVGVDAQEMARLVACASKRRYPQVPLLNGFCFMIDRDVLDAVGYMDEAGFPAGYGEENDFCIRAADAGYKLAIADDIYVYHAKSKSFGHARRKALSEAGSKVLRAKHGSRRFEAVVSRIRAVAALDRVRADVREALTRRGDASARIEGEWPRVLFLLPVRGGGGGAHSVVQECAELMKMGVDARVAVGHEQRPGFLRMYADIAEAERLFVGFEPTDPAALAEGYDVVVATVYTSVPMLKRICEDNPAVMPAYYAQDYEPLFFEEASPRWAAARSSYTLIPNAVVFAKTHWICNKVRQEHGVQVHKVEPSIDHATYSPRGRADDGIIRIAAMIRPQTPYRGAERTMRLMKRLAAAFPGRLRFLLFGCEEADPHFQSLERGFEYRNHGVLDRPQVAALLAESDLFVDLSDYQAFGRTSLEAMACGCAAVVPVHGGGDEYALDGHNALVVDPYDEDACFQRIAAVLADAHALAVMRAAGLRTASRYSVRAAAVSELLMFSRQWRAHRAIAVGAGKPVLNLLHAQRGDGLPTGSAYVRMLLPYRCRPMRATWRVKQQALTLPAPGSAQVALIQRDAAGIAIGDLERWLPDWRAAGGKLAYELDDDLLDGDALRQRKFGGDVANLAAKVSWLARNADRVLVSTAPLAERMRPFNEAIRVVPNRLDAELWGLGGERDHAQGPYARSSDGPLRIGYIGTPSHDQDLELIAAAMRRLQAEYGERIEVEIIGAYQNSAPLFGRRVGLPKRTDYPNFVHWLHQRVHWDIGVIPLKDDAFNRSKSNLKFLEYAALDMAIVCSQVDSYRDVGRDGVNALMVTNQTDAWYHALRRLIEDPDLRQSLAATARRQIARDWCIEGGFSDPLRDLLTASAAG